MPNTRLPILGPPANRWITGLASAPMFETEECARWTSVVAQGEPSAVESVADDSFERIGRMLQQANSEFFRFTLAGVVGDAEPAPFTIAPGDVASANGFGLDADHSVRKLVAVAIISMQGCEGAEVVLPSAGKAHPMLVGNVYVWPAFIDARFDLPDGGRAVGLVAHAFGPSFR